jgi:hypothetical protein
MPFYILPPTKLYFVAILPNEQQMKTDLKSVDHAMVQADNRRPLTPESQVHTHVNLCGICGGQSGTGTDFSLSSSVSPVNIIPPRISMLIYHQGDEK